MTNPNTVAGTVDYVHRESMSPGPDCRAKTIFDEIRAMSIYEFANWLCENRGTCHKCPGVEYFRDGKCGMLDWLQSPADGGDCDG